MDKNAKQIKAAKAKADEAALNRILCWIVGGVVLECFLLFLNRYYFYWRIGEEGIRTALDAAVKILAVGAIVCAAAAGYWWSSARKAGRGAGLPGLLCLFLAGLSVSCFAAWIFYGVGIQVMSVAVPGVVVLALIYYLYQREFFLIACQSALGLLGVWICGQGLGGVYSKYCYAYVIVAAVLVLASAFLSWKAQNAQGVLSWKEGKGVHAFSKTANYALMYAGAVVSLLVLIGAVMGLGGAILYSVMVAWLLIMAVYYTVKLM